jgi:hypothetical protein
MAKITNEAKNRYSERIQEYNKVIGMYLQREKKMLDIIAADSNGSSYKKLLLSSDLLNLISYYIIINSLSVSLLGIKNEEMLNEARKAMYRVMGYLEDVVSRYIDVPFADYEEKLVEIEVFDEQKRYDLVRKLGFTVRLLRNAYGFNSKYKWSFVELEARDAVITKNFINLKRALTDMDPSQPNYEFTYYHVQLAKKLLNSAADRFRERYELTSSTTDDFQNALNFLAALRRVHSALNERDDAEVIKKKMDIWKVKMESDAKRKELEKAKH